jgi:hypothetical protein
MTDVETVLVQPLRKFAKDSIFFCKRCTKPDRKGGRGDLRP